MGKKMLTQNEIRKHSPYLQMPKEEIRAFLDEFPWIKKNLKGKAIKQVYDSEISFSLLKYRPCVICADEYFKKMVSEKIFLLDKQGKKIFYEKTVHKKLLFFFKVSKTKKIESVIDQYSTLEELAVFLKDDINKVFLLFSYQEAMGSLIVYKLPNGVSLARWMAGMIVR